MSAGLFLALTSQPAAVYFTRTFYAPAGISEQIAMPSNSIVNVNLVLEEGEHSGIRTAEIPGWTGNAIACPRSKLEELFRQKDLDRTGIYILAGIDKSSGELCAYIGESVSVEERVRHRNAQDKHEFWTQSYFFTNQGKFFNKAHGLYVESELVELVTRAGRVRVMNKTSPSRPDLAQDAVILAENFRSHLAAILPVLGLDILEEKSWPSEIMLPNENGPDPPVPISAPSGLWSFQGACARIDGKRTVVIAGSIAKEWIGKKGGTYAQLQEQLAAEGTLHWTGEGYGVFTRDWEFQSPSAAATVVSGRSASGPASWKKLGASDPPPPPVSPTHSFQGAQARIEGKKTTVLAGSRVRKWFGKGGGLYAHLQEQLVAEGALCWTDEGFGVLTRDWEFKSSSAAATIVCGRSASGPATWKRLDPREPIFEFIMPKMGIAARARLAGPRMVILKGSIIRGKWVGKHQPPSIIERIDQLRGEGSLVEDPSGLGKLTQDVHAPTPSNAACIVAGTHRNGLVVWKHEETGETLKSWRARHESGAEEA
ncbi:MAG: GIY-YIG nuclease family protein [Bacteroidota bacterium]|nr:GIY-YIG nuclease family protein [Bacteroidota bacterium]